MDDPIKAAARARVAELVRAFKRNEADYLRSLYNETQARTDFITPLLGAFGWDVHNAAGQPLAFREVIEEATVEVGEERPSKKPDYELRLARQRKLFVEAKKPNIRIDRDRSAAFQTRRYGYSASLPISVLTNFQRLAIYDCKPPPSEADDAHVARMMLLRYDEFDARFDELWPLLSRQAVYSGNFDRRFEVDVTRRGADQFDDLFLRQVRSWRERLALNIYANAPGLTAAELTYAVQLFLSRIVFLRICEDREIERYETLKGLPTANTFNALMEQLQRADAFYDSGLFRLLDDHRLGIRISDQVLQSIIAELYYPQSPYTFAVVETEVLGEIYEQFLEEVITVNAGVIHIERKPEIREGGGVVPTPRYIVDAIVERTLLPAIAGKAPVELAEFSAADICCGSGIFLLSVYEVLLDHYLSWYLNNNRAEHVGRTIYEAVGGQWRLTFEEKKRILLQHIRGVDIDPNAVEVARFSLLLKLIENESATALRDFVDRTQAPALPPLDDNLRFGNSLISEEEWMTCCGAMPAALRQKISPFTWSDEFGADNARGGFDIIVGNPPYTRIQNMQTYMPEELAYYQNPQSPYQVARQDNFDKYALFIERALDLLLDTGGRLGFIVPHKFMSIQSGRALRHLLTEYPVLEEIVHFGVKPVFGRDIANYTCILIADQSERERVRVERVDSLEGWRYGRRGTVTEIPSAALGDEPWEFANTETRALFDRVRAECPNRLEEVAEIFVGVQTSADPVYIFRHVAEDANTVTLRWNDQDWVIERSILRPCLHDVSLDAYGRPQANAWMIFPYRLVAGRRGTQAQLIQPRAMAARFPGALAYLTARQAELAPRNIKGGAVHERQFYQFGRSQSLVKFDSPKIILPILSVEPRYAFDDQNIVVTGGGNGPYYMVRPRPDAPISNYVLLAILNHPLSEAFVRTHTSPFRGGYYSHGKQFIKDLPIPDFSEESVAAIGLLVVQAINASDAVTAARTPHEKTRAERELVALKTQIEAEVSSVLRLTSEDMEVVRAVPAPS